MMDNLIREADARAMVRLLGEVAADPGDFRQKKRVLMAGLCDLVGADAWVWALGCQREPGEDQVYFNLTHHGFDEKRYTSLLEAVSHKVMADAVAPFYERLAENRGQVTLTRDQLDPRDLAYQPEVDRLWKAADIDAVLMSGSPVDEDSFSCIVLYRKVGRPHFDQRECQIAHIILEEVPWLHRSGWPEDRGVKVPKLSPRQRTVLNLLLEGLGRKQIAADIHLSENTVSGYIKEIYRHFGVSSQTGLMKKFLQGTPE